MEEYNEIPTKFSSVSSSENRDSIGSLNGGEDDEFYDKIEAPKFVDFTVPDHYSPDDHYWFCLRVGCDQKHEEEMDSEAIYNNFVLRVMAARSPNVRLRKALDRNASRTPTKCPLSAPPKSSKPRLSRMAVISSMSKKMDDGKKKYLTTPRNKKSISDQSSFRSVQHPKRINKAIKVKTSVELRTPVSNKGQLSQKQELKSLDFKNLVMKKHIRHCVDHHGNNSSEGEQNGLDFEDGYDKENAAASDENRMPSNILKQNGTKIFGVHQKCDQVRKKVTQAHDILKEGLSGPVTKLKKPKATNPKPFRLRTDERGVLKEATLDRRVAVDSPASQCENTNVSTPGGKLQKKNKSDIQKGSPAVVSKTPKRQERLKSAASMTPESIKSKEQKVKSSAMQRVESRKQELISLLIPGQKLDVIHETSPQVSEPQSTGKAVVYQNHTYNPSKVEIFGTRNTIIPKKFKHSTSSLDIPGSLAECPASGTTCAIQQIHSYKSNAKPYEDPMLTSWGSRHHISPARRIRDFNIMRLKLTISKSLDSKYYSPHSRIISKDFIFTIKKESEGKKPLLTK
ncbi:hypothetical protein SASPL_134322 [Salvia splendens]|uniref:Uncharacterized protein n=1 Tax=Salvia splendens TaxID=180675 RepID=A0A8X8X6P5_SALSN|nr:hypothetical protein SASPL_134322 [Salvia splendens]